MRKRNTYIMLILIFATATLYIFYWSAAIQADLKKKDNIGFHPFLHFIFSIFTLGIYIGYWIERAVWRIELISDAERPIELEPIYNAPTIHSGKGFLVIFALQMQINEYLENKESVGQLKHVEEVEEDEAV